ncbi:MAG: hypothetical protein R3C14_31950 [Caldilineaceae bacterium]
MSWQKLPKQIVNITVILLLLAGCAFPLTPPVLPLTATPSMAPITTALPTPAVIKQAMAYVSEGRLLLSTYRGANAPRTIDSCPDSGWCFFADLSWSPDGANLVYLKTTESGSALRIVNRAGTVQTVIDQGDTLGFSFAPAWSPDGQALIYAVATPDILPGSGDETADNLVRVHGARQRTELWVIQVPFRDSGHKIGHIYARVGCGGAGYSESEQIYWREGLGTFPHGYSSQRLAWLPTDLLLYSLTCLSSGIGRFNIKSGQELPPLDEANLLAFTVDFPRQRWAAASQDNQLALGTSDQTAFALHRISGATLTVGMPVTGTVQLSGLFFGPTSGHLYYTTRELLASTAISDERYLDLMSGPMVIPFDFYRTSLFVIENATVTQAKPLLQTDAYALANLTETASGDLLFVRIDNGRAYYAAMQAGEPLDSVMRMRPKTQIMRLPSAGGAPEVLIDNAGQLALSSAMSAQ